MIEKIGRKLKKDVGAISLDFVLVVALVVLVTVVAAGALGGSITEGYQAADNAIPAANNAIP